MPLALAQRVVCSYLGRYIGDTRKEGGDLESLLFARNMMHRSTWLLIFMVLAMTLPSASACPYCASEVGTEVAAGIFNRDFGTNVVLTLLPLPVLVLIVTFIHYGFPWDKKISSTPEDDRESSE